MKVSESTNVQMPLKTVVSLITLVAVTLQKIQSLESNGQEEN
jgi:hypothetical protein